MEKKITLSVIMSVYNENDVYLKKSIESILNQTYKDFEFIIVNDDPSNEIINRILENYSLKDNRIVLLKNEKNIGLTASLNKALNVCKGIYISRMDSDDISDNNRFEEQISFIENNDFDLIGSEVRHILKDDTIVLDSTSSSLYNNNMSKALKYGNPIAHPSWLFRKEVLNTVQQYRNMPSCEDYDFLLRCISNNIQIGVLNKVLLSYRINMNGISNKNPLKQFLSMRYLSKKIKIINDITVNDCIKYVNKKCSSKAQKKYIKSLNLFRDAYRLLLAKNPKFIIMIVASLLSSRYMWIKLYNLFMLKMINK